MFSTRFSVQKRNRFSLLAGFIAGLLYLVSVLSHAHHDKTEPSDGTVRSFRAVPTALSAVVPEIRFLNGQGQVADFSAFRGKVVLLNLWATWCGPCLRELPGLDRLQAKFKDQPFEVVALSLDEEGMSKTRGFYQQLQIQNLKHYNDPFKSSGKFFPLDVVPASFIIDANGKVLSYLRSFVDWDDPLAVDMIQHYLAQLNLNQPSSETKLWQPQTTAVQSLSKNTLH